VPRHLVVLLAAPVVAALLVVGCSDDDRRPTGRCDERDVCDVCDDGGRRRRDRAAPRTEQLADVDGGTA
jgi:hypothetical protein